MATVDFNAAMARAKQAGSFEPLPDGEYELVCLEATPTVASTGKDMIKAKWQVESGPHAGSKVFDQYVFSPDSDNSLSFFFQHMRHFGLDETFFSSLPPNSGMEPVAAALPGRKCRMQLGQRIWENRPRNEVLRIMPPSSPNPIAAASGAVPGIAQPAAAAPAPAAVPQVPQAPAAPAPAVQQPAAPPVAPQPAQVPVAAPQVPAPQPAEQPQVPQPQVQAPVPETAPAPPQPVFNPATGQWELPAQPAAQPMTPEEPF